MRSPRLSNAAQAEAPALDGHLYDGRLSIWPVKADLEVEDTMRRALCSFVAWCSVLASAALGGCAPARSAAPAPAPATSAAPAAPVAKSGPTLKRSVNGTTFAYEAYGEGVPIIFLHGSPTDRRSMVPRLEPVFASTTGWRRVYPDLPGAGETPGRADMANLDAYMEDVFAFIEAESGGKPVVLAGTSWGAFVSLAFAKKHPEKLLGLGLFVPATMDKNAPKRNVIVKEPGVLDGEPPEVGGALAMAATVHTRAVRDSIKRDVMPGSRKADHAFLGRIMDKPLSYESDVLQVQFAKPALIIAGKQDALAGYAGAWPLAERFPRATFVVLDRAAHALMAEQRDLFHAHVREWLARVREGMGEPYER